jgi:hypothetical protein
MARRWIGCFLGAAVLMASTRAPLAAPGPNASPSPGNGNGQAPGPAPGNAWTPDQVRAFLFKVEDVTDDLIWHQINSFHPMAGTCEGSSITYAIKKSEVISQLGGLVSGDALRCYMRTYLGCDIGGRLAMVSHGMPSAFTRSKVTIIEQTADRLVADVAESYYAKTNGHVAMAIDSEDTDARPYTDAEVAAVKEFSRYTFTRGKDGVWRISHRTPSVGWLCKQ